MPDGNGATEARITVVFPLYRTAESVAGLVEGIARQRPPAGADPARWAEVHLHRRRVARRHGRAAAAALEEVSLPVRTRFVQNERNLGLSRSLNRA